MRSSIFVLILHVIVAVAVGCGGDASSTPQCEETNVPGYPDILGAPSISDNEVSPGQSISVSFPVDSETAFVLATAIRLGDGLHGGYGRVRTTGGEMVNVEVNIDTTAEPGDYFFWLLACSLFETTELDVCDLDSESASYWPVGRQLARPQDPYERTYWMTALPNPPCLTDLSVPIFSVTGSGGSGGGGGSPGSGLFDLDPSEAACMIADAAMVTAAFEGTAAEGEPGPARNCSFKMSGGEVEQVDVFFFGPASDWERVRQGYEDNRRGTTDVAGIGEEAFYPNDQGPRELVVRSGGVIFAVTVFVGLADPPTSAIEDVATLATAIANDL